VTSRLLSSKWVIVVVFVMMSAFGVGYGQNSPPKPEGDNQVAKPKPQKRSKPASKITTDATTSTAEATGDQTTAAVPQTPATTVSSPTEQTDLSGTYAGTFKCEEAGLTGDTTLTINGNQFTTADGKSGRIVAATTKGYTAVALQIGDESTTTPMVLSLRSRKSGDKLILSSVDAAHPCSFSPTRMLASGRSRRAEPAVPAAVGAAVANPAEVGPAPADITTSPTRKTTKAKRGRTKVAPAIPAAPAAVPAESPVTIPVPAQSPEPSPSPSPSGSPSPSPSPSPEASPSPLPSPSPSPRPLTKTP
jgi:hypothetical protein